MTTPEVFSAVRGQGQVARTEIGEQHRQCPRAQAPLTSPPTGPGRLRSTMVWCQLHGARSRRRSVWVVAGDTSPPQPGRGRVRVVMVWLTAARAVC